MGLQLIGFIGGTLVGALCALLWMYDRDTKHVGATNDAMTKSLCSLMRSFRLYANAPHAVACPACGQAGLVSASLPFTGTNSQN